MMTDPITEILPRSEKANSDILFSQFADLIDEFVNYGTHILKWEIDNAKGGDEQIPLLLLIRNFLEIADGISILVRSSSIDPSKILLRSLLENLFSLFYLTQKDISKRSMAFLVWHTQQNLRKYRTLLKGSKENNNYALTLQNDLILSEMRTFVPGIEKNILNLEELLTKSNYQDAKREFDELKSNKEKTASWYRAYNGPRNIRELSKVVRLEGMYELLYRNWSGSTHGTDIIQGKLSGVPNEKLDIVQIRFPKDGQFVTGQVLNICFLFYQKSINERLTDKRADFHNWYRSISKAFKEILQRELLIINN